MKPIGYTFLILLLSISFAACQATPAAPQPAPTNALPISTEQIKTPTEPPTSTDEPTGTLEPTLTVTLAHPKKTPVPPTEVPVPTKLELPKLLSKYVSNAMSMPAESFEKGSGKWSSSQAVIQNGELSLAGNGVDLFQASRKNALVNEQNIFGLLVRFKYTAGSTFNISLTHGTNRTPDFQSFGFSKSPNLYPRSILINGTKRIHSLALHGDLSLESDTWLNLFMAVNGKGQPMIVIWNPADQTYTISYIEDLGAKWTGYDWNFALKVQSGVVSLSDFSPVMFDTPE